MPKASALAATVAAIAAARVPRRVVIEASTFKLEDKEAAETALRKAGHVLLDCPQPGTGAQAATRRSRGLCLGRARGLRPAPPPLFAKFARVAHYLGEFGNGSKMKFVANLLVAIHNVASAEAMVLGMKAGLDPSEIAKVIASGAGTSKVFELRAPLMVKGDGTHPPSMKVDHLAEGHGRSSPSTPPASVSHNAALHRDRGRSMRRRCRPAMANRILPRPARCLRRWPASSGGKRRRKGGDARDE